MNLADKLSERSTCARLKVGCVIVSSTNDRVLGLGFNGNAEGLPNGCDSEEPGKCGCLHAEDNAIIKTDFSDPYSKKMYVTVSPCVMCAKRIINSHIGEVIYRDEYRDRAGLIILELAEIPFRRLYENE